MAYDPNLPTENTLVDAVQMRTQLTGIVDLVNAAAANAASHAEVGNAITGTSNNSNNVGFLNVGLSNPPQQWEVQPIIDKLNELIQALRR